MFSYPPVSSTSGGIGRDTHGDQISGVPFKLVGYLELAAVITTSSNADWSPFSKDCPFKFEILNVRATILSNTTTAFDGANGALTLLVSNGDGASSESFNDIVASFSIKSVIDNDLAMNAPGDGANFIVDAYRTIEVDESLRIRLSGRVEDAGSTTTVKVLVEIEGVRSE